MKYYLFLLIATVLYSCKNRSNQLYVMEPLHISEKDLLALGPKVNPEDDSYYSIEYGDTLISFAYDYKSNLRAQEWKFNLTNGSISLEDFFYSRNCWIVTRNCFDEFDPSIFAIRNNDNNTLFICNAVRLEDGIQLIIEYNFPH